MKPKGRIHMVEDLRSLSLFRRKDTKLVLRFPNFRHLYMWRTRNLEHYMNESEAKAKYGMRRFREL